MSNDRRAPWWYSGEDELEPETAAGPEADVASDEETDAAASPVDWTALVAGAARMVDWATERVMAPHAEHADPAEHPECMVCRTVTLIGDPVGLMGGGQQPGQEQADPRGDATETPAEVPGYATPAGVQPIRWIPIVEAGN